MSVLTVKPQFLYPHSRQFPFDEVAEKIVKALEKRNWKVPGVKVDFYVYGSGEAKYKKVYKIIGKDFKMCFSRCQGRLSSGRWNDTAALQDVYIPRQGIEVYDDESGPTYYMYVGKNWEVDREWFMNSIKVHSKLSGKPRRYLRYKGNAYCRRSDKLVADNDLQREYLPEGDEPRELNLEDKFAEFTSWLQKFVLDYILKFPEVELEEVATELIPYTAPWSTVYGICNNEEEFRILQGQADPALLQPDERHAQFGMMPRLVPLYVPNRKRFPKVAYEGFIWCDTEENLSWEIKNAASGNYLVTVKLKYANDVYVVDNAVYRDAREKAFEAIAPRDRLTNEELSDCEAARAATIIPITEYKGNYRQPFVLIARELDFDEIESIRPLPKR